MNLFKDFRRKGLSTAKGLQGVENLLVGIAAKCDMNPFKGHIRAEGGLPAGQMRLQVITVRTCIPKKFEDFDFSWA